MNGVRIARPPREAARVAQPAQPVVQRVNGGEQVLAIPPDDFRLGADYERRAVDIAMKLEILSEEVRAGEMPVDDVRAQMDVLALQMQTIRTQLRLRIEQLRAAGADPAEVRQMTGQTLEIADAVENGTAQLERDIRAIVPRNLHHYWSGGKLSKAAIENLLAWNEKARKNGWTQTLWTDFTANEKIADPMLNEQLVMLRDAGIKIGAVSGQMLDENSTAAYVKLRNELGPHNKGVLPWMSDLARYTALSKRGGVYADVDIHPGNVRLTPRLLHQDRDAEIPLSGPGFRTVQDATQAGYFLNPRNAVDTLFGQAGLGNHFLASRPGTKFMSRLSAQASDNILAHGVTGGPSDLLNTLAKEPGDFDANVRKSIPPPNWRYGLKWVTDESSSIVN